MRQVAAAVIIEHGRLFIARRPECDPLAGMWELPGGKLEAGEALDECLRRELDEELGMIAEVGLELARTVYSYDHGSFELVALHTVRLSPYRPAVHDATAWVSSSEIRGYRLAPADVALVDEILRRGLLIA